MPNKLAQQIHPDMPITAHPHLTSGYEAWTQSHGIAAIDLVSVGIDAIRTRHDEADLLYEYPYSPFKPDIFRLNVGPAGTTRIIYTVEKHEVVIRGFDCWNDSLNEWRGGYIRELHWNRPIDDFELN